MYGNVKFGSLSFPAANTELKLDGSKIAVNVGSNKVLEFGQGSGALSLTWDAENVVSMSDRRLKANIQPMRRTLRAMAGKQQHQPADCQTLGDGSVSCMQRNASPGAPAGDSALWMLRQLRPVSFKFKTNVDSRQMRFGFIADEVESVLPNLVRTAAGANSNLTNRKSVAYNDFIALLFAATQAQTDELDKMSKGLDVLQAEVDRMRAVRTERRKKLRRLFRLL